MASNRQNPSAIIIGAGMTGIQLVVKLKQAGITDITLLEKADRVGGTWRENTYPGVACDVPSHAYTYSFQSNPNWSHFFAGGTEIYEYFKKVFYDQGVDKYTHFNEKVTSCIYSEGQWVVSTGKEKTYKADLLFSATGILHKPVTPDFEGLNSYKGVTMHSAQWNHDVDIKGKRIGVIGTGSSATQLIPELINNSGGDVTVFQRTPQWIVHTDNKTYSEKAIKNFNEKPSAVKRVRDISLWVFEQGTTALTGDSWWDRTMHKVFAWNARRNLKGKIKDPELRAKLTPDYKFGCKRVVMNGNFYDAIQKPNAHLVTDGIEKFVENGIVTRDGKTHELDIVVMATGFDAAAFMRPMDFVGRDGVSIEEAWGKKIQAYRSICVPQFPNFFLMLGPNSPIGNYSVITMSEIQADYAIKLVKEWQAGKIDTIEVKVEATKEWAAMLKSKMSHTVWTSGCDSWYLDADGDPLTWPDTWKNWCAAMEKPDLNDFVSGS